MVRENVIANVLSLLVLFMEKADSDFYVFMVFGHEDGEGAI